MQLKLISLFFMTLVSLKGFALVTLETGEYSDHAIDFEIKNKQAPFKFFRFYNHRAHAYGILGAKWCTNLEQEIRSTNRGFMGYACGLPTQMLFKKNDLIKLKNKDVAYSWDSETLIKLGNNKGFVRYTQYSEKMVYDEFGKLISISPRFQKNHALIRIYYSSTSGLIYKLVYNNQDQYLFQYNSDKLLTVIQGPAKKNVKFKYAENNLLAQVKNFWNNTYTYTYDAKSRITQILYPNQKTEKIQYDAKLNVVEKTTDQYECNTTYIRNLNVQQASVKIEMQNDCKSKPSFFYTKKSPLFFKNKKNIDQISLSQNYHSVSRTPASLPHDFKIQAVKEIKTSDFSYKYFENELGRLTQISEMNLKNNNKLVLQFEYDQQNLKSLISSKYGKLNYVYNDQGILVKTYAEDLKPQSVVMILDMYSRFLDTYESRMKGERR